MQDAVLLTTNLTDIQMRSVNEQQLALDGLFTQHDEVFAKITNHAVGDIIVNVPQVAYHSAYPSQHLVCIPYCQPQRSTGKVYSSIAKLKIPVEKGTTTGKWVEIGSRMDTFNDGTWTFTASNLKIAFACVKDRCVPQFGGNYSELTCHKACNETIPPPKPPAPFEPAFTIQFALKKDGKISPIGSFTSRGSVSSRYGPLSSVEVAYDASTLMTSSIHAPDVSLYAAVAEAKNGAGPPGE
jgi:hypothetical protein